MSANTLLINGKINPALLPPSAPPPVVASGSGFLQTPASPNQTSPAAAVFFNPETNPAPKDGLYLATVILTSPYTGGTGTADWFDSNGALLWQLSDDSGNYYYQQSATAATLANASSEIAGIQTGADIDGYYTFQNTVYLTAGADYSFEIYAFAGAPPDGTWMVPWSFTLSYLG